MVRKPQFAALRLGLVPTSVIADGRAANPAGPLGGVGRRGALFGGVDDRQQVGLAAFLNQVDRVGIAVDDALEELFAVVVGGEGALRPAADVVQHHGEARV